MTKEEAMKALSVLKIYDAQWLREAVDMAIEALAIEPSKSCCDKAPKEIKNMKSVFNFSEDDISRQDAIDAVTKAIWHYPNECYKNLNVYEVAEALVSDAIKSLPSADRPTGHWIENDNGTFSCSNCQSWIPKEQHHYARHCLYCGARMESEEE